MRACTRCFASYVDDVEHCGIDGAPLVEVEADPLLGQVLDRYRIVELLGRGGMGSVYRGTHVVLERDFALKVLYGGFASNRTFVARFQREALALSRVRHSNIVSVVDFLTTQGGLSVMIMEYLPGRTLQEAIQDEGPFAHERAGRIARQVALGLEAAHAHGIVHRDVKPSNVLLVREGNEETAKLVDFGVVAIDEPGAPRLTAHGKVLGTPTYMSPEQASSDMNVTPRSDLYSLGVILFEMLDGQPPFRGKSIPEVLMQHVSAMPPPLVPAGGLDGLAMRLLDKDPLARPGSAGAVAAEIADLLENPLPPVAPAKPERPRLKTASLVFLGGVAAAMVAVGIILATAGGPAKPPPVLAVSAPALIAVPAAAEEKRAEVQAVPEVEVRELPEARETRVRRVKKLRAANSGPDSGSRLGKAEPPIDASRSRPTTRAGLEKKLDHVLKTLRGAKREVPANLLSECDSRYLELRAQLSDAKSDGDLEKIARRVAKLEVDLDALRYGK